MKNSVAFARRVRRVIALLSIGALLLVLPETHAKAKKTKLPTPTLSISVSTPDTISEGQVALITVQASVAPVPGQVVYFSYSMTGTAARNNHYTLDGQSSFSPGQTTTTFRLVASRTGLTSGSETAIMQLNPGTGYLLPKSKGKIKTYPQATVTINNIVTTAESQTPWPIKQWIKADRVRNRAYLVDRGNARLLAIDTDSGQIAAAVQLEGLTPPADPHSDLRFGGVAESPDGTKLYLAFNDSQQIRAFSLPDLAPLTILPVAFHPSQLAATVNDGLFASFSGDFDSSWGPLREVDSKTGAVLQELSPGVNGNSYFYQDAMLRTNHDGSRLYAADADVYAVGGPGYVSGYDATQRPTPLVHAYPYDMQVLNDFAIDEQQQRIYTMNGGPIYDATGYGYYGVQLTDMTNDSYGFVWPFNSAYGGAIDLLPNDTAVWAASADEYDGEIRKFGRITGAWIADYEIGTHGKSIMHSALGITPNGHLVYGAYYWCGCGGDGYTYYVGAIGLPFINITNAPSDGSPTNPTLTAVGFSDAAGNNDGIPNAGETVSFAPTLTNIGMNLADTVSMTVSTDSNAVLLSPATQSYGNIPYGTDATFSPFQIQLSPTLQPRSTVTITFTVNWGTGQTKSFPYTLVIQ